MIIPACPVNIPDNIQDIIKNKMNNNKITISHICSSDTRKNSKLISDIVKKIQKMRLI